MVNGNRQKMSTWVTNVCLSLESQPFQDLTKLPHKQYPRIWTFGKGWVHERQFVDEWRTGKSTPKMDKINLYCRLIGQGLTSAQILSQINCCWNVMKERLKKEGFTYKEAKYLGRKKTDRRIVVGKLDGRYREVYDLSVDKHQNF